MRRLTIILFISTLWISATASSQVRAACLDAALTPTETYFMPDGTLVFQYPDEWTYLGDPFFGFRIGNSVSVILDMQVTQSCDIYVLILSPEVIQGRLAAIDDPSELAQALVPFAFPADYQNTATPDPSNVSAPEEVTLGDHTGAVVRASRGNLESLILVVKLDDDVLAALIANTLVGEMTDFEETLLAVGETYEIPASAEQGESLLMLQHDERSIVYNAVWSTDETQILSYANDGTVRVWDAEAGEEVLSLPDDSGISGAAWSPDESSILTWGTGNLFSGNVHIWDAVSGELLISLDAAPTLNAQWSSDGTRIFTYTADMNSNNIIIYSWDANTGDLLQAFSTVNFILDPYTSIVLNADETRLMTLTASDEITVWDVETGEELYTLPNDGYGLDAAWSPDSSRIATWTGSTVEDTYTVRIWNAETGDLLQTLTHDDSIVNLVWSNRKSTLVSWSLFTGYIWNVETGEMVAQLDANNYIGDGLWNADDTQVALRVVDKVYIWDAFNGELLHTFDTESDSINLIAWSPDETRMLAWTESGTVFVWDIASEELLATFSHTTAVPDEGGARWNADGTQVLSWFSDGTVRVWEVPSED